MNNLPGLGGSGSYLMRLWRDYLEQYADKEGDVEKQIIVAAYHTVEVLTAISVILDNRNRFRTLIDQRRSIFIEGSRQADNFMDSLLNASFSIYNNLNTLSHQLTEGNTDAAVLIASIDDQVCGTIESAPPSGRPAAALNAGFPLLGLITIALDENESMTEAIRLVEQRFAAGARVCAADADHLLNALYRIVEMFQILALLTDSDLRDQIDQIANRFKEEDQVKDLSLKMRNGFCRLFELSHLLANQVDTLLGE
jgi:hypothetical protein